MKFDPSKAFRDFTRRMFSREMIAWLTIASGMGAAVLKAGLLDPTGKAYAIVSVGVATLALIVGRSAVKLQETKARKSDPSELPSE